MAMKVLGMPLDKTVRVTGLAVLGAFLLAGCEYGDHRRIHDLYPDYTDPPANRTILDYAPAATPDVVQ